MFGTEFLHKEPFKDIYVHALVRDEKGQKMSKSKGNVIDPLDLIEKYSADALRFTLLSMASPGRDVKLSEDRVKGYRNFLNKIWNANNFLIQNKCTFNNVETPKKLKININKWIYSEFLSIKDEIQKNIKDYRFDESAKNAYQFVWHSFCDWYLELSKTILFSDDRDAINEVRKVSSFIFREILKILHPFIPFITEEIWLNNKLDKNNDDFLMYSNWATEKSTKDIEIEDVNRIIHIISSIRSFKNELGVSPGSLIDVSLKSTSKETIDFFNNNNVVVKKLGRINNIFDKDLDKSSATLVINGEMYKLYFEQDVDLEIIKNNLTTKHSKIKEEMNKINIRLTNKNFTDKAPKDIVEQEKTNFDNLGKDAKKIELTLKNL
jgi:valyl-tRNA synthetase